MKTLKEIKVIIRRKRGEGLMIVENGDRAKWPIERTTPMSFLQWLIDTSVACRDQSTINAIINLPNHLEIPFKTTRNEAYSICDQFAAALYTAGAIVKRPKPTGEQTRNSYRL